ncbi:MAG: hypothetical protein H8E71_00475 [Candidatus Marinimicrobia bacterium]|nr:hypothetical protein [Candidatus Neomarinimicrobiota bacterium]MBL7109349.1 hypothetical protein [Candidatus Neomarinimicrobiota bacterium]
MLKYQIHIKCITFFILLFLVGCAGTHKTKPTPKKNLFSDPEIAAFMEDEEFDIMGQNSRIILRNNRKERPPWATKIFLPGEYGNHHIARMDYDIIGKRKMQEVADSLRDKLREKLGGDISTNVEQETRDSIFTKIVIHGNRKSSTYDHITTVLSRHYSNVIFDGVYDKSDIWVDTNGDTLWYLITFNKTKYLKEEQERIVSEIKKAGEQAYLYLKNAFNALNQRSDMEAALTYLGIASYHISKGGGSAYKPDLFHKGNDQNLLVQRHSLIKEIDKNIGISIRNNPTDKFATRAKSFRAEIYTTNLKNYNLNKVQLRINANPDILNFPSEIDLDAGGEAMIEFEPQTNSFDRSDLVIITFDVISEMIPDKEWYKSDDYTDLLKELPRLEFKIMTKEFSPLQTWAFIHSVLPDTLNKNADELQSTLQRRLGKHSDYFNVISRNDWPINYNRARDYKSEKIQFNDLKIGEKKDIQNHDIDMVVSISNDGNNGYTIILEGSMPKHSGKPSVSLSGIRFTDIKKNFEPLVEKFINDNFQRKIQLTNPVINKNNDINFRLNGKSIRPTKNTNDIFEFSGISRFNGHTLVAKSQGYRKQAFTINGDRYYLPSLSKNPPTKFLMKKLEPIQGTLIVSVLDSLTGEPIRYGGRGEGSAPIIKARKWYGFFPNPFHSVVSDDNYQGTFKLKKLGKYYVSVTKQFYGTPFPKIVTVYDDEDFDNKQFNNIRFTLEKQPIGPAIAKSFVVPGWGQWSLGKKTQGISYFTGALVLASWGGVQYYKYLDEVEIYNALKVDYLNSNENWEILENDLELSKEKLINHRNQVYGSLTSFGLVWGFNLFTVTW